MASVTYPRGHATADDPPPRRMGVYGLVRAEDGSEVLMLQAPSPQEGAGAGGRTMSRESSATSSLSYGSALQVENDGGDAADDELDEDEDEDPDDDAGDGHSFFEEYDGAPGLYGRAATAAAAAAATAPGPQAVQAPAVRRRETTFLDHAAADSPLGAYPSSNPIATASGAGHRAASFSLGARPDRQAWSPSVAAALYRPVYDDGYDAEDAYDWENAVAAQPAVELHPDAARLDAEIYAKAESKRFSLLDGHHLASVEDAPSPVYPYPTTTTRPAQPSYYDAYAHEPAAPVTYAATDPYALAPVDEPAPSLPPSPASDSGVHLSAWLAECVWSLLIHPYRPEKFGEADLRLEEQLREQARYHPAAKADSWYDEGRYSHHASTRSSFQSSPASPVTPSPCNLYYNPYGLRSKPSQAFVEFCHRTLSQTLLSSTAVVLSLWYIRRFAVHAEGGVDGRALRRSLYDAGSDPRGRGSEEVARRVLVLGLACSNKWLDDNTFTNKSWSDVTHLPLVEINRLEMLALGPVSFDLSVDTPLWTKWLYEIHSHVSPFVTDSRLVQEAIRQMFVALDDFENRHEVEIVAPRERSRWAEAETDRHMAPRLHQLAFAHSPTFLPQQPPSTPSHLTLEGYRADPFLADPAIRRASQQEWYAPAPAPSAANDYYAQWQSPTAHPYALGQQKERQHSAYGQALSHFWQSYMAGGDEQHGAFALPPLRNLAVMA